MTDKAPEAHPIVEDQVDAVRQTKMDDTADVLETIRTDENDLDAYDVHPEEELQPVINAAIKDIEKLAQQGLLKTDGDNGSLELIGFLNELKDQLPPNEALLATFILSITEKITTAQIDLLLDSQSTNKTKIFEALILASLDQIPELSDGLSSEELVTKLIEKYPKLEESNKQQLIDLLKIMCTDATKIRIRQERQTAILEYCENAENQQEQDIEWFPAEHLRADTTDQERTARQDSAREVDEAPAVTSTEAVAITAVSIEQGKKYNPGMNHTEAYLQENRTVALLTPEMKKEVVTRAAHDLGEIRGLILNQNDPSLKAAWDAFVESKEIGSNISAFVTKELGLDTNISGRGALLKLQSFQNGTLRRMIDMAKRSESAEKTMQEGMVQKMEGFLRGILDKIPGGESFMGSIMLMIVKMLKDTFGSLLGGALDPLYNELWARENKAVVKKLIESEGFVADPEMWDDSDLILLRSEAEASKLDFPEYLAKIKDKPGYRKFVDATKHLKPNFIVSPKDLTASAMRTWDSQNLNVLEAETDHTKAREKANKLLEDGALEEQDIDDAVRRKIITVQDISILIQLGAWSMDATQDSAISGAPTFQPNEAPFVQKYAPKIIAQELDVQSVKIEGNIIKDLKSKSGELEYPKTEIVCSEGSYTLNILNISFTANANVFSQDDLTKALSLIDLVLQEKSDTEIQTEVDGMPQNVKDFWTQAKEKLEQYQALATRRLARITELCSQGDITGLINEVGLSEEVTAFYATELGVTKDNIEFRGDTGVVLKNIGSGDTDRNLLVTYEDNFFRINVEGSSVQSNRPLNQDELKGVITELKEKDTNSDDEIRTVLIIAEEPAPPQD